MCADVKDSLVVKSPFPVLTGDCNKFLFFFRPPEVSLCTDVPPSSGYLRSSSQLWPKIIV